MGTCPGVALAVLTLTTRLDGDMDSRLSARSEVGDHGTHIC